MIQEIDGEIIVGGPRLRIGRQSSNQEFRKMEQPDNEERRVVGSPGNGEQDGRMVKRKRQRNSVACDACHSRRLKCDQTFPCARCLGRQINCEFTRERRKRGRAATKPQALSNGVGRPAILNPKSDSNATPSSANPQRQEQAARGPPLDQRLSNGSPAMNFHRSPSNSDTALVSAPSIGGRNSMSDAQPTPGPAGHFADDWLSALNGTYSYDLFGWSDGSFIGPMETSGTAEIGGYQLPRPVSRIRMGRTLSSGSGEPPLKYPVLQPLMPFLGSYLPRALVFDLLELYFTSAFSTHMHPVCHHIHCYVLRKASFLSRDNPRPSSPALLASMLWVAALDDRAFALAISPSKRRRTCQFLCALTVRLLKPLIHVSFKGEETSASEPGYGPHPSNGRTSAKAQSFEEGGDDRGLVGPAGSLDDIITYMHVASIVSASEQKAASMRWWHAAFTLARELKLNQEVEVLSGLDGPMHASSPHMDLGENNGISGRSHLDFSGSSRSSFNCVCDKSKHRQCSMTEEHREERRRAWWLLYIMDRHLALCYNRPLALLDAECEDLLLPLDEESWQAGNTHTNSPKPDGPQCAVSGENNKRLVFPNFTCTGHSAFGFFLPLMIITGELIDLNQAKNHPTLGLRLQGMGAWDVHVNEIHRQLDCYEASLRTFTHSIGDRSSATGTASGPEPPAPFQSDPMHASTTPSLPRQSSISIPEPPPPPPPPQPAPTSTNLSYDHSSHTQTVIAYASHVLHVLHILLIGKWDPVSLFEDKDFWTSSSTFASATSHALAAAESVEQILRYDPDVSFMPYFFGIQLLQGSFLLLLIVDRLQKEAGEGILKACEVVIRATEACVVTLSTEYQRNFRQVMRSAVAQARGRPVNHSEIRHRREAVLALYRWTRNGTGLAL